jgi:hypothetical protein
MTATQLALSGSSTSLDSVSALSHTASGAHPHLAVYTNPVDYGVIGQSVHHYTNALDNSHTRVHAQQRMQPTAMRVQNYCDVAGSQGMVNDMVLGFEGERALHHEMTRSFPPF